MSFVSDCGVYFVFTAIRTHHTFPALLQPRFNTEELSSKFHNPCFFEEFCALFYLYSCKAMTYKIIVRIYVGHSTELVAW